MTKNVANASLATLAHEYPSGHVIAPHQHRWHQLVFACAGVMTVETPAGSWVVPTHRGVWVPGGTVHSIRMSGPVSMRTLYLRPRLWRALPTECRVLGVSPLLRELILHTVARGTLDRRRPNEARLIGVICDQLAALPAPALHLPQPRDPRAARLAALLATRPDDRRSTRTLARAVGTGHRTVERMWKAETGMSLGRWRQQLRLQHALERLGAGEAVTACALEVGYESPSAFVSAFHRAFGVTPGRYFREETLLRRQY
jgi:AraC-like DNA-binding protein